MKDIARLLLDAKAVTLRPKNPFTYASGNKGPVYCDNRLLLSMPLQRSVVVNRFLDVLNDLDFDVIAGTATAGIPWASWIAATLDLPLIYIRGEKKGHGKQNRVEGKLKKDSKVLIIEDLVTTGGSAVSAVEAVREAGGLVTDCVVIFDYGLEKSRKRFNKVDCKFHSLTNFRVLVELAEEIDYIDEEEKEILMDWNANPEDWNVD